MTMIGAGPLKNELEAFICENALTDVLTLHPAVPTEEIRKLMEKADICLVTSDRFEGWGAVVNEAMNSGCAVVAGSLVGCVPYLIENGVNGFVFESECQEQLNGILKELIEHPEVRAEAGVKAYETIRDTWNAGLSAERLVSMMRGMLAGRKVVYESGPCSRA